MNVHSILIGALSFCELLPHFSDGGMGCCLSPYVLLLRDMERYGDWRSLGMMWPFWSCILVPKTSADSAGLQRVWASVLPNPFTINLGNRTGFECSYWVWRMADREMLGRMVLIWKWDAGVFILIGGWLKGDIQPEYSPRDQGSEGLKVLEGRRSRNAILTDPRIVEGWL